MTIAPATGRDVGPMLGLLAELAAGHTALDDYFAVADDWLEAVELMLLERLGRSDSFLAVARAEETGEVVGMITCHLETTPVFRDRPRARIENLYVCPAYRRRGIGRQLVTAASEWCRTRQVAYVELSVAVDNRDGERFWRALGYRPMMLRLQRRLVGDEGDE